MRWTSVKVNLDQLDEVAQPTAGRHSARQRRFERPAGKGGYRPAIAARGKPNLTVPEERREAVLIAMWDHDSPKRSALTYPAALTKCGKIKRLCDQHE